MVIISMVMMVMLILTERSRWFLRKQRWLGPSGSSQCRNQFCSRNIIDVIIIIVVIVNIIVIVIIIDILIICS